ncbi:MAG: IclR family transcriptional regulator [Syntrophorhabdaceae bacterium]|nr:IclR family transcriptional regulator [Syntrophorhabdaceae bacterium]MDD5245083.1 IclR family transcriptional regulator [Syntrophorhabdaceae bacterium]
MYNAPIIKKALEVIKLIIDENKPLGVTEIAKSLSLSKSTVFGILKALQESGFIAKNRTTKKYIVGRELLELAKTILRGGELTTVARPFLEKLAEVADETVFLCVKEDHVVKVVDTIEAKKTLKISSPVGTKIPITASVLCKVFLSPFGNDEIRNFLKERGLPKYTENSITDIELFIEEVEKTRRNGYGLDLEEYMKGVRAIATLIYSQDVPVGAICILGFTGSMTDGKLGTMAMNLFETAQKVSQNLTQLNIKA